MTVKGSPDGTDRRQSNQPMMDDFAHAALLHPDYFESAEFRTANFWKGQYERMARELSMMQQTLEHKLQGLDVIFLDPAFAGLSEESQTLLRTFGSEPRLLEARSVVWLRSQILARTKRERDAWKDTTMVLYAFLEELGADAKGLVADIQTPEPITGATELMLKMSERNGGLIDVKNT
jgi:hypothetical protein